jgi:hypothetical protein
MKKILFALVILAALIAAPALATINYCNLDTGDDTNGDGSYSNPYQTILKCTTGLTAGDECRVAKTAAHTQLSGTLSFTEGSTTVSTTADLTGELAAGDYIGKGDGVAGEAWWPVSAVSSNTITLPRKYYGHTESGATGYKLNYHSGTQALYTNAAGTSAANRLKVTGGWNLATQTRDGWTWIYGAGAGYGVDMGGNNDYLEIAYFGLAGVDYGLDNVGDGSYIHNISLVALDNYAFTVNGSGTLFENFVVTNCLYYVFYGATASYGRNTYQNGYLYSNGNSSITYAFNFGSFSNLIKNVIVKNQTSNIVRTDRVDQLFIDSCDFDGSSSTIVYLSGGNSYVFIRDTQIKNAGGYGFYCENLQSHVQLSNVTFSGNSSGEIGFGSGTPYAGTTPGVVSHNHNGTAGDDRMYYRNGAIYRDTANARSGSCLKFAPASASYPIGHPVGTVKVTSTASDLTLAVYLKDDASFNGHVYLWATQNSRRVVDWTEKTPTTSYVQNSITVAAADLEAGEYVDLYATVDGTAGNVYVDDFSASQP